MIREGEPLALRIAQGLAKVGLAMKTRQWRDSFDAGISPTQAQILSLIRFRGPMRLLELADAMGVTAATASDAVSALASKGLLTKRRSASDGRAVSARLTARGRKAAERLSQWPDFLTPAIGALSTEEQRTFLRALVKMIRTLQEQKQIPVARMCVNCRFFRPGVHADADQPHHCDFVDAPFGDGALRMDCPDFQAGGEAGWRSWVRLSAPSAKRAQRNSTD